MKANRGSRITLVLAAAAAMVLTASCSERRVEPSPAPTPTSRPAPPPPLPPSRIDWRDAPITPGDWTWAMEGSQSVARFAGGLLMLRCDMASRTVTLQRTGVAQGTVALLLRTSNGDRQLAATPQPGSPPVLAVSLPGSDRALDAVAFSRGRFALEAAGLQTLYVPSWPEIAKVVEDCR